MYSDRFLISLKSGDESSFHKLYEMYSDKIYRFGYNLRRDKEFAENLVQETFIKVFQNIKKFKKDKKCSNPLNSWIYKIAKNQAFNEMKKLKRESRFVTNSNDTINDLSFNGSGNGFNLGKGIESQVIEKEQLKKVYEQLDLLSLKKRTTFVLFFVEELTADEVAVIMKENRGSTLKRLQRLKDELKKSLSKEEV